MCLLQVCNYLCTQQQMIKINNEKKKKKKKLVGSNQQQNKINIPVREHSEKNLLGKDGRALHFLH